MSTAPIPVSAARRKRLGAWYTTVELVDHVLAHTLPATSDSPIMVLDPACGDGRFLAAAAERLGDRALLGGVDIDNEAVLAARIAVPQAEIVHADALAMDWGDRRFDVVVGNPPFLNQMASATSRGGGSRFGGGPYVDTAAEFLALSAMLAKPNGGRLGLVLPQSMLTTRDAGPIRRSVLDDAALIHAWWPPTLMFDASVRTCALVFEMGATCAMVSRAYGPSFEPCESVELGPSWGSMMTTDAPIERDETGRQLGDKASFTVDFRDQYHGLVGAVSDDAVGPPLITSGLIEPGRCLWGERPVRFAKQQFAAPRVDLSVLSSKLQRWADVWQVPKILIANQTRVIEAVLLTQCSRSSPATTPPGGSATTPAGSGLAANSIRLTPALLASIPL